MVCCVLVTHRRLKSVSQEAVIPLSSITNALEQFTAIITIKSLDEIAEALTQVIFNCQHNEDLMGRSEIGGLPKRVNKEINRQAIVLQLSDRK